MTEQKLEHIRHTLAHLLGASVMDLYPGSKLTLGPAIDNGFYYDIDVEGKITDADLEKIEETMKKLLKDWDKFSHKGQTKEEALEYYKENEYKKELIEEISERGENITFYTVGDFTDLCRGGHTENPKEEIATDSFKLDRVAGAYWRGDEKNKMLTRIYGLAFESKEALDEYLKNREEAQARDHKKLGKELDLFVFSPVVGKGLPLWTPKGSTIRRELERFIVDEEIRRGYLHVYTPDIAKLDLYKKSGHYPYYKESMYAPIVIDDEEFMLRPMTCPHHFELYSSKPHSYRDLPMRIAELAQLYRYEQSGELSGLQRVRTFCLADAHIICADENQAVSEIAGALDLIEFITEKLGLKKGENYWYRLSLGDREDQEKYYKDDEAWEKGESLMRELLEKRGGKFVEAKGEAAFYGPKIDIQMKNVNGKEDTAFTVQYDFCMPTRFDLTYKASDGTDKRPFVVHRSSIGAIERVMAFLIEYYSGNFPTWLSPTQIAIIPVKEQHQDYANALAEKFKNINARVAVYGDNGNLGTRIHEAKKERTPYILVVGDKEIENNALSVEKRDGTKETIETDQFLAVIDHEIKNRL